MGYGPLIFELVIVLLLCICLLKKYSSWRQQSPFVAIATLTGWYFSFIIIFVLPLDVVITFYHRCELEKNKIADVTDSSNGIASNITVICEPPAGYVPDDVLYSMWRIVYWSSQLLTWIILPLMQSYSTAGDFTSMGKLKTAIVNNAIYYGIYMVVLIVLLVYAVVKGIVINSEHVKVMIISASNTWGLLLLVGLLGYGLVHVPRQFWQAARPGYRLNKVYFNVDVRSTEKRDAEDAFRDTYKEARSVLNALKNDHLVREKAQIIVSKLNEVDISQLFPSRSGADFATLVDADPALCCSEKYLVNLHVRAIEAIHNLQRTHAQWNNLMREAFFYEDLQEASLTGLLPSPSPSSPFLFRVLPPTPRYYWYVVLHRPIAKALGVLFSSMTVVILLSECTFFIVNPTLSPAALLLHDAARRLHYTSTQVVSFGLLTYICACAYTSLFRLRIYRYYHLDGSGHTDANSLLFSAALLCRLTPPICLNLLGLIHLDSHITQEKNWGVETQFTKLMGHLDLLPVLAKGINVYLPLLIILFCALTYYKLGTRLMHSVGMDQFVDEDEVTMDAVTAGKALVQLERNRGRRAGRAREERNVAAAAPPTGANGYERVKRTERGEGEERRAFVHEEDEEEEVYSWDDITGSGWRDRPRAQPPPQGLAATYLETKRYSTHPPTNLFDDM